jgi:hypothetical protein
MNLFRGSWNVTKDETPVHSPVRLLQKLAAYRAATGSTSIPSSPSPQNERKSTILSESTNFFTRLWRHSPIHQPKSTLIACHDTASSLSFEYISEPSSVQVDTSTGLLSSPRPSRRMSFIREVLPKNPTQLFPFPLLPPPSSPPPLQAQPTTSSTVTDPSFEDITLEHPSDTASEMYSQSFETNINNSNPGIDDGQQGLTYDERNRRLSLSAKPVIPLVQHMSSYPMQITAQQDSDSLASPEANIDVSMVSSNYFLTQKKSI